MSQRDDGARCVFCMIVAGELPSEKLYEDEEILAFRDIEPAAPFHVLVIPKEHIPTVNDLENEQATLLGRMALVSREIARKEDVAEDGYRLVTNVNRGAGQIVFHLHMHVLGGTRLGGMC